MNPLNSPSSSLNHHNHHHTDAADQAAQRHTMLMQDLDHPELREIDGALSIYLPIIERLHIWQAPTVRSEATMQLIDRLSAELVQLPAQSPYPNTAPPRAQYWGVLLLRSQFKLVQWSWWAASALVILLGTLVTLATNQYDPTSTILPFVLIAPIVTASGIVYVYSLTNEENTLEIELAAPISPRLLALARITLVFGFNLILSLIASLILAAFGTGLTLMPLVATWLAPMAFLSALAFLLSVLLFDPWVSMLFSGVLWVVMTLRQYALIPDPRLTDLLQSVPNVLADDFRPMLWVSVVMMMAAAIWLIGKEERWLQSKR